MNIKDVVAIMAAKINPDDEVGKLTVSDDSDGMMTLSENKKNGNRIFQ